MTSSGAVGDLELWARTHPMFRGLAVIGLVLAVVRIAQASGPFCRHHRQP
jgi:hypothetical protein